MSFSWIISWINGINILIFLKKILTLHMKSMRCNICSLYHSRLKASFKSLRYIFVVFENKLLKTFLLKIQISLQLIKLPVAKYINMKLLGPVWRTFIVLMAGKKNSSVRIVNMIESYLLCLTGVYPCCSRSPNIFRPRSTHSNHLDSSVKIWWAFQGGKMEVGLTLNINRYWVEWKLSTYIYG